MITKGIIKRLYTSEDNHFIVYIPLLQKANMDESDATLPATYLYIPGISKAIGVNDIVYVDFEDNNYSKPVILGKLFIGEDNIENITTSITVNAQYVKEASSLPANTKINGVNIDTISTKVNILSDNITDPTPSDSGCCCKFPDVLSCGTSTDNITDPT